jgi:hypothetical protein
MGLQVGPPFFAPPSGRATICPPFPHFRSRRSVLVLPDVLFSRRGWLGGRSRRFTFVRVYQRPAFWVVIQVGVTYAHVSQSLAMTLNVLDVKHPFQELMYAVFDVVRPPSIACAAPDLSPPRHVNLMMRQGLVMARFGDANDNFGKHLCAVPNANPSDTARQPVGRNDPARLVWPST